jgi:hypothetical protein
MTHQLTPSLQLTTGHSASSHGIPVLVRDKSQLTGEGEGYYVHGPGDVFEYGGLRWPAAKHVVRFAKHHPDNAALQAAAAAFCSQWPEGPQIETE